jgi:5-methyltetrahydropteroyltriglutamate--homocysteine methyltransferase
VTVEEAFMPAVSPATVEAWHRKARNAHYESNLDYLFAIADALHEEYRAIVEAGFVLQIDDPGLLTFWQLRPEVYVSHQIVWSGFQVQALNHALRGIAKEKIRFHTCYGINIGPRVHDMELYEFFVDEVILQVHAGAISFEAANPRHEHEWQVWEKVKLPDGVVLIPGVISNSTVLVEHPELVAQRICRFAKIVGRENVIAGSDGGFANLASSREIHPSIVWAKLQALADGARIATKKLFSPPAPPAPLPTPRAGQRGRRPRTARAAKARSPRPR